MKTPCDRRETGIPAPPRSHERGYGSRECGVVAAVVRRWQTYAADGSQTGQPEIWLSVGSGPRYVAPQMSRRIPHADGDILSKVPEVTLAFWVIKILATTLGETGGDAVSMSLNLGYLLSTVIFGIVFIAAVFVQIRAARFHPVIYWFTIVASTTVGTTLADFATRSIGIGYTGGSVILLCLVLGTLFLWKRVTGSVSVSDVSSPRTEVFYWLTITFSQTLGTALGDWTADAADLGYLGAAAIFAGLLALVAAGCFFTRISRTILFWSAFVLTRPLGAVVGDFLDKPIAQGGLEFSRFTASALLAVVIVVLVLVLPQRAARRMH